MSEIVGLVGMSHSPFATLLPPAERGEPGSQFMADAARVRRAVVDLAPDAIIVIGPDHFHSNFYDVMPPFVLGVEEAIAFGDFNTAAGPIPVASDLAWDMHRGVASDFDVAVSYSLTVDHGIVQSYEMITGNMTTPLVPLVVNTAAPPLPSLRRCNELGRALGDAIRGSSHAGKVLLVASGGLSHWLPSNDPRDPSVDPNKKASLVHGRKDPQAFSAAREPRVRAMGGNPDARVNAEWDAWFLDQAANGDLGPVADLGNERLEEVAGTGGHEVRCWMIAQAAARLPMVWTGYEPVPEWITGMGIGSSFPVR